MSPSSRRLWVLGGVFLVGFAAVALHLVLLTVVQHDQWLVRSYRNRWSFRDVPTRRGSLLDPHGRVIATDRPSFEVSANYRVFRRNHPVGAAVHGANLLSEAENWIPDYFGYRDRSRDPLQAFDVLMQVPLGSLRSEHFRDRDNAAEIAQDLRFYAIAVLSACTGQLHRSVGLALAKAMAEEPREVPVWQVATEDLNELRQTFTQRWRELLAMEGQLSLLEGAAERPLIEVLERWRQTWLRFETPENSEREWRREDWFQPIQDRLPFALAASIRLQQRRHPGLKLTHSVERIYHPLPGREDSGSLAVVVGGVTLLNRADNVLELDELVAGAMESFAAATSLAGEAAMFEETAARSVEAVMHRSYVNRGRTGSSGAELALEEHLAGTPGFLWAIHDQGARNLLVSNLDVSPGQDVTLTLDLELQSVLEAVVDEAFAESDPTKEVALVLIDAESGDVLAMGGRPLREMITLDDGTELEMLRHWAPGLGSQGSPDVGSVAKPFVLLEHLSARRQGRPHQTTFAPCQRKVSIGGMLLGCEQAHGPRNFQGALAQSCNVFFFQVAQGLEEGGLHRAYQQVGWMRMEERDGPAYQVKIPGIQDPSRPRLRPNGQILEQQAIGYGVEVNALYVARAYAALATGSLPRLRLVNVGEPEPAMPLNVHPQDLDEVQRGLRACVVSGTGRRINWFSPLDVHGKTGTAEIGADGQNNAWFAGYLPRSPSRDAPALAFAAVAYFAPDKVHGGEIAGGMIADLFRRMEENDELQRRYLPR